MDSRTTQSGFRLEGRIDRKTHSVADLKSAYPDWDEMSDQEKLDATRGVPPTDTETVYNLTTDSLHEYFVDNLNPSDTTAQANVAVSWLGLGNDSATGTTTADTDLNNRVYEATVSDAGDNGKELLVSTFLGSTEGNGFTYDELGLFSGDPANLGQADVFLINHATFASVSKDNTKTITFDVTLTFSDT